MPVIENAPAKINLVLVVTGRRADGYHELQTVFQSIALHDTLTLQEIPTNQITLVCDDPSLPVGPDNLVWRAAERLKHFYRVTRGVHISLEKNIPVAAGLAGGSSDAAAALRGLVRLWDLPWESQVLYEISAGLGSDVPFCLYGGTALGTGRGEQLTQLEPCPFFHVVLANPGFGVSTADIFRALQLSEMCKSDAAGAMENSLKQQDPQEIIGHLINTLEQATFRLYPAVKELKEMMNMSSSALMCGSGPTIFALFATKTEAVILYELLLQKRLPVWLTTTSTTVQGGIYHA